MALGEKVPKGGPQQPPRVAICVYWLNARNPYLFLKSTYKTLDASRCGAIFNEEALFAITTNYFYR